MVLKEEANNPGEAVQTEEEGRKPKAKIEIVKPYLK